MYIYLALSVCKKSIQDNIKMLNFLNYCADKLNALSCLSVKLSLGQVLYFTRLKYSPILCLFTMRNCRSSVIHLNLSPEVLTYLNLAVSLQHISFIMILLQVLLLHNHRASSESAMLTTELVKKSLSQRQSCLCPTYASRNIPVSRRHWTLLVDSMFFCFCSPKYAL